jgi:type VI protein secretion system component VasF
MQAPRGFTIADRGQAMEMEHLPSPARAERNQQRKLAFIPVWPVILGIALVVLLVLVL